MPLLTDDKNKKNKGVLNQLLEELTTPPIISAVHIYDMFGQNNIIYIHIYLKSNTSYVPY